MYTLWYFLFSNTISTRFTKKKKNDTIVIFNMPLMYYTYRQRWRQKRSKFNKRNDQLCRINDVPKATDKK